MRARIVALPLCLALASCGGDDSTPTAPTALNLTGSWTGFFGEPQSGSALRMTWTVVHTGNVASGTATLVKPAFAVTATGQVMGTLQGSQMALTITVPAGSVPGFASCSILGAGMTTAQASSISGTMNATFSNCQGSGLEPPASNQLTLTK